MASVTVFEVIDTDDGESLRATLSRDKAEAWLQSEKERGSKLDMAVRATVRHDVDGKVEALARHLDVDPSTIEETRHSDDCFECSEKPGEYRVLTESERETAADEALDSYIDEWLFAAMSDRLDDSIVDTLKQYFDRDAWKRDALLSDGYGHTLSPYDGAEEEEKIDGVWYFIYRVN